MKSTIKIFVFLFIVVFAGTVKSGELPPLIPAPASIRMGTGTFKISSDVVIVVPKGDRDLQENALLLTGQLLASTGFRLKIVNSTASAKKAIRLLINKTPNNTTGDEGYFLEVKPSGVKILANHPAGLFYGTQTLIQLIPPGRQPELIKTPKEIPALSITDYPRFEWRGLMLDVSRHFFGKEFIKKYIDQMVKYKFNVFHWHLSDDPGWRIEIKKYPQLTRVGAWRVPRTGKWGTYEGPEPGEAATDGGYYTQADIREIVKYASDRYVTIVPEIDIPGHSQAFVASFPAASCTGGQYIVYPGSSTGMGANVLCAGNDDNFKILDDIFGELASLFPGQYIHIGGDEVNKEFWKGCQKCKKRMAAEGLKDEHELQSYFIKRVEKIVESKGKKLIGWDEILEGGLAPNAAVMSWRGTEGGIASAKAGHHVVMSPTQFCYLDYQQTDWSIERTGGGFLRLSDVYKFDPLPEGTDKKYILGGQGNVWTEFISTPARVEYMTWPRALALSEVLWSAGKGKNPDEFIRRTEAHFFRFDAAGVNYSHAIYDPFIIPVKNPAGNLVLTFSTEAKGLDIYYTFDSTLPDRYSARYNNLPVEIPKGASEVKAVTYKDGKPAGRLLLLSINELRQRAL